MLPIVFRVSVGLFFVLLGIALVFFGTGVLAIGKIPEWFTGVVSLIAGIAAWANI